MTKAEALSSRQAMVADVAFGRQTSELVARQLAHEVTRLSSAVNEVLLLPASRLFVRCVRLPLQPRPSPCS
jgi:hypothetical protein